MTMMQTRRRFLTTLSLVGAVGLLRVPRTLAAEGELETTSVRIAKNFGICIAPEYLAEELLRAEGFTQVQYVDAAPHLPLQAIGRGGADFLVSTVMSFITAIDAGDPITMLSGVMVGCYELFGNEAIRGISDLKGKSVGVPFLGSGPHQYVTLMAADVGSTRSTTSTGSPAGQKDRCLPGFSARAAGSPRPPYRTRDPQHRQGPALVAIFLLHAGGPIGTTCGPIRWRPSARYAPF